MAGSEPTKKIPRMKRKKVLMVSCPIITVIIYLSWQSPSITDNQPAAQPIPGPSQAPQPAHGPSQAPQPIPGPSQAPQPIPGPSQASQPIPGPSQAPQPIPGPSQAPQPAHGPSQAPQPAHGPSQAPQPPQVCGCPVKSGPLIKINGSKSYVVTPYVEHRGETKKIRVISIVYRQETIKYHCLLCCRGSEFLVHASLTVHTDHYGFNYGAGDFFCPIPDACKAPEHVAIFSSTVEGSKGWQPTFIPVLNQQPKSSDFNFTFTICISTMYGNYDNLLQVVQAMEMYRLLGVQRVAIYKNSCSSDVQKALDYYEKKGFVEIIPWQVTSLMKVSAGWKKSKHPGEIQYYGQIPALNDCVYRYMYRTEYVALHDIDELILPLQVENWSQLLKQLEQEHSQGKSFMFENHVFPTGVFDEPENYRPKEWRDIQGVNVLEHVFEELNYPGRYNYKVIVKPRSVFEATVHGLLSAQYGSVNVDTSTAHIYHIRTGYRSNLTKDQISRDDRIRHYASKLIPAVSEVLRHVKNHTQ